MVTRGMRYNKQVEDMRYFIFTCVRSDLRSCDKNWSCNCACLSGTCGSGAWRRMKAPLDHHTQDGTRLRATMSFLR